MNPGTDQRDGTSLVGQDGPRPIASRGGRVSAGFLARLMAWSAWALTALAVALVLFLVYLNGPSGFRDAAPMAALILAFSTAGTQIASRRPGNPIGWIFCSGALMWALGELALEYAVYALVTVPGAFPAASWAVWFGGWARGVGWFLIVVFLLLLFPTGRLPSTRWRPVLWGGVGFIVLFTIASWLSPVSNDLRLTFVRNPLGFEAGIGLFLTEAVFVALPVLVVANGTVTISRFRRSRGDERQQLKWFAYAVGVMVAMFVIWFLLALAGRVQASVAMWTVPLFGLPVAVGVAILKHRLYDIDLVINLTLVYGALTAALGSVYLGGVASLQYAFGLLAGGGSRLAVVASTLAIAAMFNSLRRRIQSFIDRLFYRRKYDAAETLRTFSATLRGDTDLETLSGDLTDVVRETLHPTHVYLWLRETGGEKS